MHKLVQEDIMKKEKDKAFLISSIKAGQLNAMVKNIMNQCEVKDPEEAVRMINSGELVVTPKNDCNEWFEKDGLIHLNLRSDGTTGEEWYFRLKKKGYYIDINDYKILRSKEFKPTKGEEYSISILKGTAIEKKGISVSDAREEGKKRQLVEPNLEVICLLRDRLTCGDISEMGLCSVVIMNVPVKNGNGVKSIFTIGPCYLNSSPEETNILWGSGFGFAFSEKKEVKKENFLLKLESFFKNRF